MNRIRLTPAFERAYKRFIRKHPQFQAQIDKTIAELTRDYLSPSLKSRRLQGRLANRWSCSVAYDLRILFDVVPDQKMNTLFIDLLNVGTHDQVY